jgi:type IV secretory pathway TrbL component
VVCESRVVNPQCSCPLGWQTFECSCYQAFPLANTSWLDAGALCRGLARGSDLVVVQTPSEQAFVLTLAKARQRLVVYLGLRDVFDSGFVAPEMYAAWGGGRRPDAGKGACGAVGGDGAWYAYDCGEALGAAVCTMPLASIAASVGSAGDE